MDELSKICDYNEIKAAQIAGVAADGSSGVDPKMVENLVNKSCGIVFLSSIEFEVVGDFAPFLALPRL